MKRMVLRDYLKATALLLLAVSTVESAVLGIDFGAEHIKASIVAPKKPFKIIFDASSKRKWRGVVGFPDDDTTFRLFGNDAKSRVTRRPQKTFYNLQEALGRTLESEDLAEFKKGYMPYEFVQDEARNGTAIAYADETYAVEELVAMILEHTKALATDENEGVEVRDSVIVVPDFWSHKQRQAIMDAAEIANLNVLSLIDENTAVATQYGIEKMYEANEMWKSENEELFAFYNMGHQSTKVSVVKYSAYKISSKTRGQFEVLAKAWDSALGGEDFDLVLTRKLLDFAREGLAAHGLSEPESNARVMAKLKQAANKAKFVLSSNKEKRVSIEGLHRDFDFRAPVITREDFEEASADLFDRVLDPLERALELSGLDRTALNGVVLMGGCVRIPRIKAMLVDWAGDVPIKKDINGDEAAAVGAAFRAANMSTTFRVRPIGMNDITPFGISVRLHDLPKKDSGWMSWLTGAQAEEADEEPEEDEKIFSKRGTLYKVGSRLGKRKAVAFKHAKDLRVELKYDDADQLPSGTDAKLGVYKVTGVEDAMLKYPDLAEPKVKLTFVVDQSGIAKLVKGVATFIEEREVEEPGAAAEGEEGEAATEDEPAEDGGDGEEGGEEQDEAAEGDAAEAAGQEGEAAEEAPVEEFETKIKQIEHREALAVELIHSTIQAYTAEEIEASRNRLTKWRKRDRDIVKTAETKNNLEGFIYENREKLYEDENVLAVSTEEEREAQLERLQEAEDWLWDDEEPDTIAKFADKLANLRRPIDKIIKRAKEMEERPEAVEKARATIEKYREKHGRLNERKEWLPEEDREKLKTMIDQAEEWLDTKIAEQEAKDPTEQPAFTCKEAGKKTKAFKKFYKELNARKKPRKDKPKVEPKWAGVYTQPEGEEADGGEATILQDEGSSIVRIENPAQDWSPAMGTVELDNIRVTFGEDEVTGKWNGSGIEWSNGSTWVRRPEEGEEEPAQEDEPAEEDAGDGTAPEGEEGEEGEQEVEAEEDDNAEDEKEDLR